MDQETGPDVTAGTLALGERLEEAIRRHCEEAYPNECCGALLGTEEEDGGKVAELALPMQNAREEGEQFHRFRIEPEDFMTAERIARENGLEVIGFYHSHPDHPAIASGEDMANALPFYSYVIVQVEGGKSAQMLSWQLARDRSRFVAEKIERKGER